MKGNPGRISLTFDGWTSKTMLAYVAVMAHFITEDWQLHTELLSFSQLEGSHSGENMSEEILNILKEYQIGNKVSILLVIHMPQCLLTPYLDPKLDIRQRILK